MTPDTDPSVSVLLPFVNEGSWLKEAMDSILKQSFHDFEIILIDNGADSVTREIACSYAMADHRVQLLEERNKGIAHALNAGIRVARGKYIARMDADDIALPDRIQRQVELLESEDSLGVVASKTEVFPATAENEGFIRFVNWQNSIVTPEEHALSRFIESPVAHPSVMMRKKLFDFYGHYATDPVPEDYELWLRWMKQGVCFRKHECVLLRWRDHPDRLSRSHDHYAEAAFLRTKASYLFHWTQQHCDGRPIVVCGSSRTIRQKIRVLETAGIRIEAVTDVKEHPSNDRPFLTVSELKDRKDIFVINLIARSDLRDPIRNFLSSAGKTEGEDFILAG